MNPILKNRIENLLGSSLETMYPGDMSQGQLDTTRERLQTDPEFAERYYEGTDYDAPLPSAAPSTLVRDPFNANPDPRINIVLPERGVGAVSENERVFVNQKIREQMEALMNAQTMADDPVEKRQIGHLQEGLQTAMNAPFADQAAMLANMGRGDDSTMAHLRAGEVVLPPEAFDDPVFEAVVENKFNDLDINPEKAVVGVGIASLNPSTGLEEFGFFKKIAKGVKKVVKKVAKPLAQVGQFIPGPHQPFAAMANKAFTVYDVAKGRASPFALAGAFAPTKFPTGGGGGIGGLGGFLTQPVGGYQGNFFDRFIGGIGDLASGAYEYVMPGADNVGLFGNLGNTIGRAGEYILPGQDDRGLFSNLGRDLFGIGKTPQEQVNDLIMNSDEVTAKAVSDALESGMTPEQILGTYGQAQQMAGMGGMFGGTQPYPVMGGGMQPYGMMGGNQGFGFQQAGLGGLLQQALPFLGTGAAMYAANKADDGLFGLDFLTPKNIGIGALVGGLGKLAYDATKDEKGVPLTPLTQMSPTGRYNIEAEIANRMGQAAPNPVEFGLLPAGTFPELTGGAPAQRALGGPVMAFAEGGDVDETEYKRMSGDIDGAGTETSDDIPAMLSDGEFVMTGRAVRGAGSFDMKEKGGIITLKKTKEESRSDGTDMMYKLMDTFEGSARAAT